MICKRAIMDILKQAARDDDDAATVTEVCLLYFLGLVTLLTEVDRDTRPSPHISCVGGRGRK